MTSGASTQGFFVVQRREKSVDKNGEKVGESTQGGGKKVQAGSKFFAEAPEATTPNVRPGAVSYLCLPSMDLTPIIDTGCP